MPHGLDFMSGSKELESMLIVLAAVCGGDRDDRVAEDNRLGCCGQRQDMRALEST